jgi:phosphoribosylamine-glycine ligase
MYPTLKGIVEEGMDYVGVIFFGLMITQKGVYLLEYNVRFGDPETQAVLPLMESDLMEVLLHSTNANLSNFNISWKNQYSCCVVASSEGYPFDYKTGYDIKGTDKTKGKVFAAGIKCEEDVLKTSGGRVLGVTSLGSTPEEAREKAYADIRNIT